MEKRNNVIPFSNSETFWNTEPNFEKKDTPKTVFSKGDRKMNSDDWMKLYIDKLDKERELDRIARDKMIESIEKISYETSDSIRRLSEKMDFEFKENQKFNKNMFITTVLGLAAIVVATFWSTIQTNQSFTQIIQGLLQMKP